jgi:hypothetical protein
MLQVTGFYVSTSVDMDWAVSDHSNKDNIFFQQTFEPPATCGAGARARDAGIAVARVWSREL